VSFVQFFGSVLQVTPHFHLLVSDGVFVPQESGVSFEALPPPTQAEVKRLLRVVRLRVLRLLEKRGAVPAQGPEGAQQAYQAHSLQQRLRWLELDVPLPPSKQPRCSFLEGFSLHANTHLHANDRQSWSDCAATEHAGRWRWSVCHELNNERPRRFPPTEPCRGEMATPNGRSPQNQKEEKKEAADG